MKYEFTELLIFPLTQPFWPAVAAYSCGVACFGLVFLLAGLKLQRILPFLVAAIWAMLAQPILAPNIVNQSDATKTALIVVLCVAVVGSLGLFWPKVFYAILAAAFACKIALLPAIPGMREIQIEPASVAIQIKIDDKSITTQAPPPAQWFINSWKHCSRLAADPEGRDDLIFAAKQNTVLICVIGTLTLLMGIAVSRFTIAIMTSLFGVTIITYAATIYFAGRNGVVGPENWNQLWIIAAAATILLIGCTILQMKLFKAPPADKEKSKPAASPPPKGT